jgi:hypothetical protein
VAHARNFRPGHKFVGELPSGSAGESQCHAATSRNTPTSKSGKPSNHFETVRQRKDRSLVDISLAISPIRNSRAKIVGASKIARDITELKEGAQSTALAAERNESKNLFALSGSIVSPSARSAKSVQELAESPRERLPAGASPSIPSVDLLAGFIPGDSVSLLNCAFELFCPAVDLGQVVVGELSPLLLHGALQLLPVSFDPVPIHCDLLNATYKRRPGHSIP